MRYFMGLEVLQNPGEVFLGQGEYAVEILDDGLKAHDYSYGSKYEVLCF